MVSKDHRLFIGIMLQYLRGFNFFFIMLDVTFLDGKLDSIVVCAEDCHLFTKTDRFSRLRYN